MIKKLLQFARKITPMLPALVMLVFLIPDAYAAEATTSEVVQQAMATAIVTALRFLSMILWPVLLMIGDLMDSNLIIGPGMEDVLREIWVQIRNLVNIGFAIVMIIIAFYNLLGLGSEGNFALKTALPKLIIGIVIVNFTFLAGKIVIDLANVATTAIFQLPEIVDLNSDAVDFTNTRDEFRESICVRGSDGSLYVTGDKDLTAMTKMFCEFNESSSTYQNVLSDSMTNFFDGLNANNIGVIMAVNLGSLEALSYVDEGDVPEFEELLINGLFSIVMFIVFAISYIVLAAVLVFRVVVLWIAMALSPLAVLVYVVPQIKEAGGGGLDLGEKVTKHILAPIIIGATLCIGFIMVEALQNVVGNASSSLGSSSADVFGTEFLISGIANMQQLIVAVTAIVVVWTGVFGATSGTFAEGIANSAKGFVENTGKTILGGLKYAPIVPVPLGPEHDAAKVPMSFNQLGDVPGKLMRDFGRKEEEQLEGFLKESSLGKALNYGGNPLDAAANYGKDMQEGQLRKTLEDNVTRINDSNLSQVKSILTHLAGKAASTKTDAADKIEQMKVGNFKQEFEEMASSGYFGDEWKRDAEGVAKKLTEGTPYVPAQKPNKSIRTIGDVTMPDLKVPDGVTEISNLTPANRAAFVAPAMLTQDRLTRYFAANPGATVLDAAAFIAFP